MSSEPPKDSDAARGEYRDDVLVDTGVKAERAASALRDKSRSDLNYNAPSVQYGPNGTKFYLTAPTQLKRLFASPLVQSGQYAKGPNHERWVTSGWGDARSVKFGATADTNRRHGGLDFRAPVGENVLACADGTVTFVGFQRQHGGPVKVNHPHVPDPNNVGIVVDDAGTVVALPREGQGSPPLPALGHGGVYITIAHDADFHGYVTQYMHLSDTAVRTGQRISEGDVIGKVGRSGGNNGITDGPHLHWQVLFNGVKVKPEGLAPNYFPGHPADTQAGVIIPPTALDATLRSVGEQIVHGRVLGTLQALERAVTLENLARISRDAVRTQQATASVAAAKSLSMHAAALYEALAKFQGALPVVTNVMAFDFDTGLWTDNGKPV